MRQRGLYGTAVITQVDTPIDTGGYGTSIKIGADGLPVVSYYNGGSYLKVAHCANAACTGAAAIASVDTAADDVGRYSSIAIGKDGLPVVSYFDATNARLKVLKCNNRFGQ